MKVRLETEQGELVGDATIAPFMTAPPILLWGTRLFLLHENKVVNKHPKGSAEDLAEEAALRLGEPMCVYRETWFFAVVGPLDP